MRSLSHTTVKLNEFKEQKEGKGGKGEMISGDLMHFVVIKFYSKSVSLTQMLKINFPKFYSLRGAYIAI